MSTSKHTPIRALLSNLALTSVLVVLLPGCHDDSPCDKGQELQNAGCYALPVDNAEPDDDTGSNGNGSDAGGDSDGGAGTESGGPPADSSEAQVGEPCVDTAASSDCGGAAPICAPLPTGAVCTQILCLDGETHAGACPNGWNCRTIGKNPSVCLNF